MLKKIRIKKSYLLWIGLFLISLSAFIFIYSLSHQHYVKVEEQQKIEEFFISEVNNSEEEVNNTVEEKVPEKKQDYNYIAVLEIPSIKLKRGLVSFDSKYNNVKYNIQIIEHSNMPNIEKSNLILASHNGTSGVSFFNKLDRMSDNCKINVYYNGIKYIYSLSNHYEVDKDGKIPVYRDREKNTITLITCKKNSKTKQVVYIGYLEDKVSY